MFRGDYTTKAKRLIPVNSFLQNASIKDGTDITYSERKCDFVKSLPEVGDQSIKGSLIKHSSVAKNLLLI